VITGSTGIFDILARVPAPKPARGIFGAVEARWWTMRAAQSLKPASYVCPFCDGMLHATSEHALVAPEGDASRRRHAHMDCVLGARKRGELPTEDEWRRRR
jgi:hypothetical protein